jgi:hypothetical protein
MNASGAGSTTSEPRTGRAPMNLEVEIIPVSDVDRANGFYELVDWRLDDVAPLDGLHIVQLTPVRVLDHVRQRIHRGRTGLGGRRTHRLRHRGGS